MSWMTMRCKVGNTLPKVCLKVWKVFGRDEGGRERVKGECTPYGYICTDAD